MKDRDTQYGNLMSYKHYTRPGACRLYGSSSRRKTWHQRGMQEFLRIMFENGACATWDIAKLRLRTKDVSLIRTKEKGYRAPGYASSGTSGMLYGMLIAVSAGTNDGICVPHEVIEYHLGRD